MIHSCHCLIFLVVEGLIHQLFRLPEGKHDLATKMVQSGNTLNLCRDLHRPAHLIGDSNAHT
ncbi:MAG TPA: hypothetical protein DCR97_07875 [Deltaproteobacteria bacterium]|nr:hypothetical protein [Deltaproteobacteria bacterium]